MIARRRDAGIRDALCRAHRTDVPTRLAVIHVQFETVGAIAGLRVGDVLVDPPRGFVIRKLGAGEAEPKSLRDRLFPPPLRP